MMKSSTDRILLLLHDQLSDSRVWDGFADLVSVHARVVTVDAPAPPRLSTPSQWADHLAGAADRLVSASAPAALAVATGSAVAVATSLVEARLAGRALLINPPLPTTLVGELPAPDAISQEERELFVALPRVPDPPERYVEQVNSGVIREEGAAYLLQTAMESLDGLDDRARRLVEQIHRENVGRMLPLSLESLRTKDFSEVDWVEIVGREPIRYTVALSRLKGLHAALHELLSRQAPGLPVVDLPLTTLYPWLEDPGRMAQMVRELL
jgi:hypothetical protein